MNQGIIIGNLTRDPEMRETQTGKKVCTFTVAVNNWKGEATFFKISAWEKQAELCEKYLARGRRVAITGEMGHEVYLNKDGKAAGNITITAKEVEFLSPRTEEAPVEKQDIQTGYIQVDENDFQF